MAGESELLEALNGLKRRMQAHLWKHAQNGMTELEDLEQETVCRMLQTGKVKAMNPSQTEAALWVTFKNLVTDWKRRNETARTNEEIEWLRIKDSLRQMAGWDGLDLKHFYKEILKCLPPRGQLLMNLTFRERLKDPEIAAALGIREDNVRSQRRFWLNRIREELERESRLIKKGLPLHNLKLLKREKGEKEIQEI